MAKARGRAPAPTQDEINRAIGAKPPPELFPTPGRLRLSADQMARLEQGPAHLPPEGCGLTLTIRTDEDRATAITAEILDGVRARLATDHRDTATHLCAALARPVLGPLRKAKRDG